MFSNIGFAEMREMDQKEFEKKQLYPADGLVTRTLCVDGYKFVLSERADVVLNGTSVSMSMVQFFEERDGKSLPAKC